MIANIKRTSKTIYTKDGEFKILYTSYDYRKQSTVFKYASSDDEAREKFLKYYHAHPVLAIIKTRYPSLDILLNNEFILTN